MTRRLAALLPVLAAAACAGSGEATPDDDAVRAAAVGVVADGCGLADDVGSGVVAGAPGQVVTVAHTLRGAQAVTVVASDGTEHEGTVVAFDPDADLAIVEAPTLGATPLPVASSPIALGDATVYGWTRDDGVRAIPVEVTRRLVITIEDIFVEDEVTRTGLELSGEIDIGVSGGPVVDADGELAGIVYARSRARDAVGFATDADEVRDLMAERPLREAERCGP